VDLTGRTAFGQPTTKMHWQFLFMIFVKPRISVQN